MPLPPDEVNQYHTQVSTFTSVLEFNLEWGHSHIQESYKRQYVLHKDNAHDWRSFINMNDLNIGDSSGSYYYSRYPDHAKFVDIIYISWATVQSKKINLNVESLLANQTILLQKVSELQSEVNQLKQKNADLSYQVQLTAYSLQLLQPVSPVYDYKEIKVRKQILHSEFKRLSKLMRLG